MPPLKSPDQVSPRRTGAETKAAIQDAAVEVFADRGFDVTSLEVVASQVGVSRALVLHHFASKADILDELVRPVMGQIDALLDQVEASGPLTTRQQRGFLTEFVDLLCDHRSVATLLIRDITAHPHLGPDLQLADRAARFVAIVNANEPTSGAGIRALAALGAIVRPLSAPNQLVDLTDVANRRILINCALAALRAELPGSATADTRAERRSGTPGVRS